MTNKEKAIALIKTIETQSKETMAYIHQDKFIHHTVRKADGVAGLIDFLMAAPKGNSIANPVRVIEDGDYVFLHTDFDFYGPHIGFDVMRFEDGKVVEMWDCIQPTAKPNPSGHTMIDGATAITDIHKTEENKTLVKNFMMDVLVNGQLDKITHYYNNDHFIQHNASIADGISGLLEAFQSFAQKGISLKIETVHKVLGEGNFVLTMSEGYLAGQHSAFFDLFRVENAKIVEHWDVIEPIAPKEEWKNTKGRF